MHGITAVTLQKLSNSRDVPHEALLGDGSGGGDGGGGYGGGVGEGAF